MGQTRQLKGKIIFKHQTAAEWELPNDGAGVDYKPDVGELIIYDPDDAHPYIRLKFGNGADIVKNLPFAFAEKVDIADIINTLTSDAVDHPLSAAQGKELKRLMDELTNSFNNSLNEIKDNYIPKAQKGVASGVAELDASGKVPSAQLPSFVDDVLEYSAKTSFPTTGEAGKIYVDTTTNLTYRWSGSAYVEISASLALGETSSTAYRGDRGKTAYDHSQSPHAPSDAEKNQNAFSNIKVGSTTVAADVTTDTLELAGSNITITPDATNDKVTIGLTKSNVTDALGYTPPTTDNVNSTVGTAIDDLANTLRAAAFVDVDSAVTSTSTNVPTSKAVHTQINNTIDGFADTLGALAWEDNVPSHSHSNYVPTSRTINGKALSSNLTLTAADVGALPSSTTIPDALADLTSDSTHRTVTDAEKTAWNAKSNFSGSYNDLTNKPTIPTVDSELSTSSTNPVQNKAITTELNKKAGDFSIEIYNGTSGNPKPVRFASFNYSTCISEEGIAAKISLVSGHGNGTSYAFLEDAIIRVNHLGDVEVDNFKYYGASAGTYDGANRQYGDIFWLVDTTNKIVDFYVLMGQYARVQQTPWKRLTYSTKGTVTQYISCSVYSSGEKQWANNSEFVLKSDIDDLGGVTYSLSKSGSTITLTGSDGSTTSVTDDNTTYTHPASHAASMITGLATVATSGKYSDLSGKPTIPTVNNATLTIQKNGTNVATFTANSSTNATANITVPTKTSELTNDSGFKTTDNNTTYTIASGDSNGQIKVTPSSGSAYNVSVKGLGSAAYTASTAYATAAQGTKADNALPKSGGTMTGPLTITGGDATTAGKMILSQSGKGQITDSGTSTLFGFVASDSLTVGHGSYKLLLRGNYSRPSYNGSSVAMLSDVEGKAPAYQYSTTDLTAGSSALATGTLYFVYE